MIKKKQQQNVNTEHRRHICGIKLGQEWRFKGKKLVFWNKIKKAKSSVAVMLNIVTTISLQTTALRAKTSSTWAVTFWGRHENDIRLFDVSNRFAATSFFNTCSSTWARIARSASAIWIQFYDNAATNSRIINQNGLNWKWLFSLIFTFVCKWHLN